MPAAVLAALFLLHGSITTLVGAPVVADGGRMAWASPGLANASWLSWWPTSLGRSWAADVARLGPTGYALGSLVWVASGAAFLGAGLGLLGMPGLSDLWQPLALAGGALGLVAVVLFFHPWYLVALLINLAVIATQAGSQRSPFTLPGA
jgi:hypothetical protein